jgi:hypothetical protein
MIRGWAVLTLLLFPQDGVEPLARDLESTEIPKIYHAIANLSALGEKAIPQLEARAKDAKGRVRDYLQLAADEIRAAGLLTGIPAPKRITMKSADRNVIELLGELRTKTGLAIALENLLGEEKLPEIPVDIRDATALEAFDAICKAGNVSSDGQRPDHALPGRLPGACRGSSTTTTSSASAASSWRRRRTSASRGAELPIQMEMLWDPAAAPCRFNPPVVVEAATTRGKKPDPAAAARRRPPKPTPEARTPARRRGTTEALVPPALPALAGSEKISVLRGSPPSGCPGRR